MTKTSQQTDPYNLARFLEAQDTDFAAVRRELKAGSKQSHWMWFVFPQIAGLGRSPTARRFAISSGAEAAAYLTHPVLGPRLEECTSLTLAQQGKSAEEIFGWPDWMKFRSSMTLFSQVAGDNDLFERALKKYFSGKLDAETLRLLTSPRGD
jgi:uncharacterized protein (DUF1810 family)